MTAGRHERFPAYIVWKTGHVLVERGRFLAPVQPQKRNGYLRVKLVRRDGRRVWVALHTLVLEAFRGPRPTKRHHCAHLDGDRTRNHLGNLLWKLPEANEADKKKHGTAPRGGRLPKLDRRKLTAIRCALRIGYSKTAVALRHGVHRKTVAKIAAEMRTP